MYRTIGQNRRKLSGRIQRRCLLVLLLGISSPSLAESASLVVSSPQVCKQADPATYQYLAVSATADIEPSLKHLKIYDTDYGPIALPPLEAAVKSAYNAADYRIGFISCPITLPYPPEIADGDYTISADFSALDIGNADVVENVSCVIHMGNRPARLDALRYRGGHAPLVTDFRQLALATKPLELSWSINYGSLDDLNLLCAVGPGVLVTAMEASLYESPHMALDLLID